jgi:hypothetical protein
LCAEKISKPKRKTKNIGRRNNNKENFLLTFTFIIKRYKRKNINIKNKIPNKNILISKYEHPRKNTAITTRFLASKYNPISYF